jgi:hypothetical protein
MDAVEGRPPMKTLSEWLINLRPGDACICCGAELQSAVRPEAVRTGRLQRVQGPFGGRPGDADGLVCPSCGCELTNETCPASSNVGRTLSTAA